MHDYDSQLSELHERILGNTLSDDEGTNYGEALFDSIKHINEYGQEFWYARELQVALEYKQWRRFCNVIDKAKAACSNSENKISDHFADVGKIVEAGATHKNVGDIQLSRYACYLIVQNGDSRKKVIALGQTYFAVKTRQQELIEKYDELSDDQKRLAIRREMANYNKLLVGAAKEAGVKTPRDYAVFQNFGYKGLYGGMTAKDIHEHKQLKPGEKILDHMGYEELAANLFRATQTEAKLRRDNVYGKNEANETHYTVGKKVRDTIADLGGTMPEELPTPLKSIRQLEKEEKNRIEKR